MSGSGQDRGQSNARGGKANRIDGTTVSPTGSPPVSPPRKGSDMKAEFRGQKSGGRPAGVGDGKGPSHASAGGQPSSGARHKDTLSPAERSDLARLTANLETLNRVQGEIIEGQEFHGGDFMPDAQNRISYKRSNNVWGPLPVPQPGRNLEYQIHVESLITRGLIQNDGEFGRDPQGNLWYYTEETNRAEDV